MRKTIYGAAAALGVALTSAGALAAGDITFADARVFPESVTSGADGTIYIGSIGNTAVYRAKPGETAATVWIDKAVFEKHAVFGLLADDASNTLWVCSAIFAPPGSPPGPSALRAFDLAAGTSKTSYSVPGGGLCNDIAVAKDGTVYVAETVGGRVLRVKKVGAALEEWAKDPKLATADGIAVLADGAVYVNGVATNVLVRIPVNADGSAGAVESLEPSRPLKGPDGMRAIGSSTILLVEGNGGTLSTVTISGTKAGIKDVRTGLEGATAVTLSGGTAYVTLAKLNYLFDPSLAGKDPGPFSVVAIPYPAQ